MPHFTTIQTQIRDVAASEDACAELGLELLRDAEARGYSGQTRQGAAATGTPECAREVRPGKIRRPT